MDFGSEIRLILKKEEQDTKTFPTWRIKTNLPLKKSIPSKDHIKLNPSYFANDPLKEVGERIFSYDHSDTLIDLFLKNQNDKDSENIFLKILKDKISYFSEECNWSGSILKPILYSSGVVALCFYTLLRLGFIEELKESLSIRTYTSGTLITLLRDLEDKEYDYLNSELSEIILQKLDAWGLHNSDVMTKIAFDNAKSDVKTKILDKIYRSIKKEIRRVNLEINQDEKSVKGKLDKLGFNEKYKRFLEETNKYIYKETSEAINSGMINNLRSFMSEMIIDLAEKISKKKDEEIPQIKEMQKIGNCRKYLKNQIELSDKDDKFLNSFINILHEEGGHPSTFTSEKEYFRLTRNIVIEITLFLLDRYEKKFGTLK